MPISPIELQTRKMLPIEQPGEPKRIQDVKTEGTDFGNLVERAIDQVDQDQKSANQAVTDVVTGQSDNLHDAMISMQKAQTSFQLMTEIRNRVVETYRELSRMQI